MGSCAPRGDIGFTLDVAVAVYLSIRVIIHTSIQCHLQCITALLTYTAGYNFKTSNKILKLKPYMRPKSTINLL